jgi:hypothetical protein
MKDSFELVISPGGVTEGIYQDDLADTLQAETKEVRRASLVEFEDFTYAKGWTVRAAHNPRRAIRMDDRLNLVVNEADENPAVFTSRELALKYEQKFFWELLERPCGTST